MGLIYNIIGANPGGAPNAQLPFTVTPQNAPGLSAVTGFPQQQQAGASNPFSSGPAGGPRKTLQAMKRRTTPHI